MPLVFIGGGVDVEQGNLEVVPKFHSVSFSKMLTFYRKGSFVLTARYKDSEVSKIQHEVVIGEGQIHGVEAGAQGEAQKVKVKVRVNLLGVFQVVTATLLEKQGSQSNGEFVTEAVQAEPEGMETQQPTDVQETASELAKMETNGTSEAQAGDRTVPAQPRSPKQVVKAVELQVENKTTSISLQSLQDLKQREVGFQSVDHEERDRIDSKNTLEEFVLNIRSWVYVESSVRDEIILLANNTENWLYDGGEDCKKNEYVQKLDLVKAVTSPAQSCKRDHEGTPHAAEQLAASLNRYKKALSAHLAGDEAYNHWTPEEVAKLKTKDLPVKAAAFLSEQQAFESIMNPVLNKFKPLLAAADKSDAAPPATEDKTETD